MTKPCLFELLLFTLLLFLLLFESQVLEYAKDNKSLLHLIFCLLLV